MAGSRHSRLLDELAPPTEDHDAAAERERLSALLAELGPRLREVPAAYRRAARLLWLAAGRLLRGLERRGGRGEPVRLGLFARLGLLLRARWAPGG